MMFKRLSLLFLLLFIPQTSHGVILQFDSIQDAEQVPFDNSTNGFIADDVQEAIEELSNNVAVSASPGFTWGKSGNVSNAYLLNDTVPCNTAGRLVPVSSGQITTLFVAAELSSSATVEVRRRDPGPVFTLIASTVLSAQRTKTDTLVSPPSVNLNDELCIYINGAIKNPVIGLIIKGSI